MSPYELSILLDIYIGRPIRENQNAPIYPETISALLKQGWVNFVGGPMTEMQPSKKLQVFVEHILALPEPIQEWTMP